MIQEAQSKDPADETVEEAAPLSDYAPEHIELPVLDAFDEEITQPQGFGQEKKTSNRRPQLDTEILEFYGRIVCEICDPQRLERGETAIEYDTLTQLNRHVRSEHNQAHGTLRCPICEKRYRTRVQLLQHKEMHLHPDRYRCEICFEVHQNMAEHRKAKHGDRAYNCEKCNKRFVSPGRLAIHARKAHAVRDVTCDRCNKPFSKYTIDDHRRNVHEASFICEYCPKTFKSRFWLKSHLVEHGVGDTPPTAVKCTICGTVVKNKYILVSHMRRVHSDQPAVSCGTCGKTFKSQHNLNGHLQNVCTDRAFPCAVCGKVFKKRIKLNEHMTTHTGETLYRCQFCPSTFSFESHFYTHRKQVHREQWLGLRRSTRQQGKGRSAAV
ncbi:zinc finger protein 317-like [Anopheles aquasalis]|uniref:zinc finger protein 317-like n=1 Tax=Anopheles aquasalis TaxID=42839 RepID=UPI00215A8686|nr:zinc finger protein 317-like [Anopheles aquasalis]